MNILGHLFFTKNELDNPFYVLGLIYPGLDRENRKESFGNIKLKQGIDEHIRADIRFHSQEWFKNACIDLAKDHPELEVRFKSHLYHWALEIAVDYRLNKDNCLDDLFSKVEYNLTDCDLIQFLLRNNEKVFERVYQMADKNILRSYDTTSGCIEALKRIHDYVTSRYNLKSNAELHFPEIFSRSLEKINIHMEDIMNLYDNRDKI